MVQEIRRWGHEKEQPGLTDPDRTSNEVSEAEAAAMLRAVLNLFGRWRVTKAQARVLLGSPSASTCQRWTQGEIETVPDETIVRLADLLRIHKALRMLFMEPDRAYAWIARPNEAFGGRAALERMLDGTPGDIAAVRAYLEGQWDDFYRSGVDLPGRRLPEHQTREPFD